MLDGQFPNEGVVRSHYEVIGERNECPDATIVYCHAKPDVALRLIIPKSKNLNLIPAPDEPTTW
jgi:hypothetical protein